MPRNKRYFLLVDGYNIINSWEDLKSAQENSLDEARELLIDMMSELSKVTGEDITIVFDSYLQKNPTREVEVRKGITIIFTKENETADNYIEYIVSNAGVNDVYKVASSDAIIQSMIFGKGGSRISSRELYYYYKNSKDFTMKQAEKKGDKKNKNIVSLNDKSLKAIETFENLLKDDEEK